MSWSFIRGILVTALFMFNSQTDQTAWGTLAICSVIILAGIELAQTKNRQIFADRH